MSVQCNNLGEGGIDKNLWLQPLFALENTKKYKISCINSRREKITAITISEENRGAQSDWIPPDGNIDKKTT